MISEAQKRAQKKYDAENVYQFSIRLSRKTDAEIIAALEEADSRQGLVREALREYIRVDKFNKFVNFIKK